MINLPSEVKTIFGAFNQGSKRGHDLIRLVGGCVRDLILKKLANDFDFATSLEPNEVIQLLENNKIKAVPTGINYGTITAVINHKNFEITTLRKDNETDGRHLKAEFVNDYYLDAARRDFTINALYLDDQGQVYDYFNGIEDLRSKKVKFIGDATTRITEDYLRILRFFRFSCFYSKEFDQDGIKSCAQLKSNLRKLSNERVRVEIFKIFSCLNRQNLTKTIQTLNDTKISEEILGISGDFNCQLMANLFLLESSIFSNQNKPLKSLYQKIRSDNSKIFSSNYLLPFFAAIFNHDNNFESNLRLITTKLKLTNKEKNYCQLLSKNAKNYNHLLNEQQINELLAQYDKEFVADFYLFNLAVYFDNKILDCLSDIVQNFSLITDFVNPDFPINGNDLIKLGYNGKKVGEMLKVAKRIWIDSGFNLNKNELLKSIK